MNLETALSKARTVSELVKATGMSRGGVIQALRRNSSRVRVIGTKREHERGPESNLYQLRAGKSLTAKARAKRTEVADPPEVLAAEAAIAAQPDVQTAVSPEAVSEVVATLPETPLADLTNDQILKALDAAANDNTEPTEPVA